jgi:hypothetical protein
MSRTREPLIRAQLYATCYAKNNVSNCCRLHVTVPLIHCKRSSQAHLSGYLYLSNTETRSSRHNSLPYCTDSSDTCLVSLELRLGMLMYVQSHSTTQFNLLDTCASWQHCVHCCQGVCKCNTILRVPANCCVCVGHCTVYDSQRNRLSSSTICGTPHVSGLQPGARV